MDLCLHGSSKGLINAGIGIHFLESWPPRNPKMILDFCRETSDFAVALSMGAPLWGFHAGTSHATVPPAFWVDPSRHWPTPAHATRKAGTMDLDASGW